MERLIANILTVIGVGAFLIVIGVLFSAFIAAILALAAVFLFMIPLFLLCGASGVADRRPHPWDRDYHRSHHYRRDY
ncbi:hypothetical protein CH263_20145 [Rhodococcus sp. 06-1059B-a]|nr:hypothetical protein [Rhodococcus sp. 06-1059B-a]OZD60804.1 hypothetical protein CH263_20145 [Rhodococcus sp. 06-1059B-a]